MRTENPLAASVQRQPRRLARLLFSTTVISGVLFALSVSSQAEILMRASAGFDGKYKNNKWTPVAIYLKNTGDGALGRAQVSLLSLTSGRKTTYTKELSLPKNSRKRAFLYIHPSNYEQRLTARYISHGKTLARVELDIKPISDEAELHVVVGSASTGLEALGKPKEGEYSQEVSVVHVSPTELPNDWVGYDGVDALTFTEPFVETLSQEAQRAITAWVASGGHVAISTGQRGVFIKGSFWEELLPLTIKGSTELKTFNGLPNYIGEEGGVELEPYLASVGEMTRGEQLAAEGATPLAVRGRFGKGDVTYLALGLDSPPFKVWSGKSKFWRKLLAESLYPAFLRDERRAEIGRRRGRFQDRVTLSEEIVANEIQPRRARDVKLLWAFWLIALYVLAIGPIDYLVVRIARKPKLTWLTFSASVIGFSAIAYWMAHYARSGDMELNAITFLDVLTSQRGVNSIHGRTYFAIYSPQNRKYEISAKKANAFTSPLEISSWRRVTSVSRDTFEILQGARSNTISMAIPIWSAKTFRTDWYEQVDEGAPSIDLNLSYSAGALTGTIRNRLGFDLESFKIFAVDEVYSFGEMRDGETRAIAKLTPKVETFGQWGEKVGDVTRRGEQKRVFTLGALSLRARLETHRRRETFYDRYLDLSGHSERGEIILVGEGKGNASEVNVKGWHPRTKERVIVRCTLNGGGH